MSGEPMTDDELMPLFEAARWAPSAMNNQLWRFMYAKRDSKFWDTYFDVLADGNKIWCAHAAVLVFILSRSESYYKNKPHQSHAFEAGSAFQNLALEGTARGLVVHPMGGFDKEKAAKYLKLPAHWHIQCMIAIGKPGNIKMLPKELRERETPSDRRPLDEIVFEGKMGY
jgi:nitroreductase